MGRSFCFPWLDRAVLVHRSSGLDSKSIQHATAAGNEQVLSVGINLSEAYSCDPSKK